MSKAKENEVLINDAELQAPAIKDKIPRFFSPNLSERTMKIFVLAIFFLSTLIHGLIMAGPHQLTIYHDELLYWRLAESFTDQPFMVYHVPVYFSKFLYSLVLAPLFLIKDSVLRAELAGWMNALMVSWSIFPAYRIARRITPSRTIQLFSILLFIISPMMNYCEKYITESLFLPMGMYLVLGFLWLFDKMDDENQSTGSAKLFLYSLLLGFYAYLSYLAKESALAFSGCFIVWALVSMLIRNQAQFRTRHLIAVGGHILALIICFALQTLLISGENSYSSQIGIENINTWNKIGFYFRCLIQNSLFMAITSFGLPLLYWQLRLNRRSKLYSEPPAMFNWVIFLFMTYIVIQLGTTFSINVREDLGKAEGIRLHTRYVIPFFLPLLAMTLDQIRLTPPSKARRGFTIFLAVGIASVFILTPIRYASTFDSVDSWHIRNLSDATGTLTIIPADDASKDTAEDKQSEDEAEAKPDFLQDAARFLLNKNIGILLIVIAFTGLMILLIFMSKQSRVAAVFILAVVMVIIQIYNNADTIRRNKQNGLPTDKQIAGFVEIDRTVREVVGEENLLVISNDKLEGRKRRLETFLSCDFYIVQISDLKRVKGEGNQSLKNSKGVIALDEVEIPVMLKSFTSVKTYPKGTHFTYVLCCNDSGDDSYISFNPATVEKIKTFDNTGYTLYRMVDPSRLDFDQIEKTTYN